MEKFYRQWATKLDFERLKMKHALMNTKDKRTKQMIKEELDEFINKAYE
jgi:hypothetical protein